MVFGRIRTCGHSSRMYPAQPGLRSVRCLNTHAVSGIGNPIGTPVRPLLAASSRPQVGPIDPWTVAHRCARRVPLDAPGEIVSMETICGVGWGGGGGVIGTAAGGHPD